MNYIPIYIYNISKFSKLKKKLAFLLSISHLLTHVKAIQQIILVAITLPHTNITCIQSIIVTASTNRREKTNLDMFFLILRTTPRTTNTTLCIIHIPTWITTIWLSTTRRTLLMSILSTRRSTTTIIFRRLTIWIRSLNRCRIRLMTLLGHKGTTYTFMYRFE